MASLLHARPRSASLNAQQSRWCNVFKIRNNYLFTEKKNENTPKLDKETCTLPDKNPLYLSKDINKFIGSNGSRTSRSLPPSARQEHFHKSTNSPITLYCTTAVSYLLLEEGNACQNSL
ncbi:unnamed protein product [Ectocarpus sp. 8 AP-2014]